MNLEKTQQEVIIQKQTQITTFSPEQELDSLVEKGDWELVLESPAFLKRNPESQAQIAKEAIEKRIDQLGQSLNLLVNRGPKERAAAMGILQRKEELEKIRDEILENIYSQFPRSLDKQGVKIDF